MIYDFETLVSRKNTGSGKWDEMTKEHPNLPENVAPLSVADMEPVSYTHLRAHET